MTTDVDTADPPALEQVYREQRIALTRLGYLLTGSRDLAEDIVQAAFASAAPRWDSIDRPLPYLRRAVVNMARDAYRRRARERGSPAPEPVTHLPEVDEAWAHIRRLPDRQRAVVVLRYYEDLPLTEIAALLSRPAATVRSDLSRALKTLKKALT
ncbi:RNA polymerase sigma factor (sigma-70 family) [Allocatelliglobosispora scoriae]|uniref:RNA polymerase sigma factor (Sigma-70 family) n=1 Tax=Allocatelliglobosispora scoriae TaxID=643052 RepID=A0A841BFZ8_9ACTN|nr:sigma-70 family RNA polymerase sigma factor [Allocatelliglobosispora scoriae]MBB5867214.1 RNA polymerase sigma factor (sigma-70 family) [Allocatelliglobosispora scoriae]